MGTCNAGRVKQCFLAINRLNRDITRWLSKLLNGRRRAYVSVQTWAGEVFVGVLEDMK